MFRFFDTVNCLFYTVLGVHLCLFALWNDYFAAHGQHFNTCQCSSTDLNDRIIEIARHLGVDPTLLNQPFSEMLLLPISKRLIHWKAYADYLGLSPVEAQTIETDSHESLTVLHHRPLKVLKTWMKNNNFAGTTKDLMKACLEVGSDAELAGSVCRLSNGTCTYTLFK